MGTKFVAQDRLTEGKLNFSLGSSSYFTTLRDIWKSTHEQVRSLVTYLSKPNGHFLQTLSVFILTLWEHLILTIIPPFLK